MTWRRFLSVCGGLWLVFALLVSGPQPLAAQVIPTRTHTPRPTVTPNPRVELIFLMGLRGGGFTDTFWQMSTRPRLYRMRLRDEVTGQYVAEGTNSWIHNTNDYSSIKLCYTTGVRGRKYRVFVEWLGAGCSSSSMYGNAPCETMYNAYFDVHTGQYGQKYYWTSNITLRGGDVTGDGRTNIADVTMCAGLVGKCAGEPGWNPKCTFQQIGQPGCTDESKLQLISREMGQSQWTYLGDIPPSTIDQ
jgi:hypothetical protein